MNGDNGKMEKALRLLKERGLEGLIIYSNGTCSLLRPSYLHYFAGVRPLGSRSAAVLSVAGGGVAMLVEPPWDASRIAKRGWIRDVRGTQAFARDLAILMEQYELRSSVGLAGGREMNSETYSAVKKQAGVYPAEDILEELARTKTSEEIGRIRRAGEIADEGFRTFFDYARMGVREYELVASMEFAMRSEGADDIFILLSSGAHNYEMHEPTDRRLREGDIVIGEITPVCQGQFLQLCVTLILGPSDSLVTAKYRMLMDALDASLKKVRPGEEAASISREMNRVISKAGYAKYCYPPYMRARGHGFGVGSIAPGAVIDDETRNRLEPGQVVVVHPNQYLPETGYLACGMTVLVTETGMERLSKTEIRLYAKEV